MDTTAAKPEGSFLLKANPLTVNYSVVIPFSPSYQGSPQSSQESLGPTLALLTITPLCYKSKFTLEVTPMQAELSHPAEAIEARGIVNRGGSELCMGF